MPASKYRKQIAKRILHRLADPNSDVRDVIKPLHATMRPLLSMLRDRTFQRQLRGLLGALRLQREIELQRASVQAASILARQVSRNGTMSEARRRTCIELIRLARSSTRHSRRDSGRLPNDRPGDSRHGPQSKEALAISDINPELTEVQARALLQTLESA
jgi:hypothetical protein